MLPTTVAANSRLSLAMVSPQHSRCRSRSRGRGVRNLSARVQAERSDGEEKDALSTKFGSLSEVFRNSVDIVRCLESAPDPDPVP